jgi:hypothetical protein
MNISRNMMMAGLALAVIVIGFLYYERTKNDITIQLPKIQVNP